MLASLAIAMLLAQDRPCLVVQAPPTQANEGAGKPWYIANERIVVLGKTYEKYGLPRVLMPSEVRRFADYKGVILAVENVAEPDPEVLYLLTNYAGCEFQPYQMVKPQPRPASAKGKKPRARSAKRRA